MHAIILYSYATLTSIDDVGEFYRHIMHSYATEEVIEQGKDKFRAIGLCDPLSSTTKRLGRILVQRLEKETGEEWKYYIGNKHTYPFVKDAVEQCIKDGVKKIIAIPTTPIYAKTGTELYHKQARKALEQSASNIPLILLTDYYKEELFIDMMAERLVDAYGWLSEDIRKNTEVIFTSHSLPGSIEKNRNFIQQYEFLASKLMEKLPKDVSYSLAYRSAGPDKDLWLSPDILDVMRERAHNGAKAFVCCELLSIIANAEVIQEVGNDAHRLAEELNVDFVQTEYIDDHYDFVEFLVGKINNFHWRLDQS